MLALCAPARLITQLTPQAVSQSARLPVPAPTIEMLSDNEIARAAAQLAEYQRSNALSQLLDQYAVLIDDYKRLKSDYEEERESREKYKKLSKGQERNPFVLVLVDGDGYVFSDTLLSKRVDGTQADGGNVAAQLLNDEVRESLLRKGNGLENCQIMVRIYANVFGLSTALHRAGVLGSDSRSLAPFIANFNRSYGLTEFVDAGPLKENADAKLRALLRLYADNAQCKHIYFAACHDVGYITDLTPYTGNASKFTLVRTPGIRFHDEFTKLGMPIEEFRGSFRHTPLDSSPFRATSAASGLKPASGQARPTASPAKQPSTSAAATNGAPKPVCVFNTLGICKHGKACKDAHENAPSSSKKAALPVRASLDAAALAQLPKKHEIPAGFVLVNENKHRIDPQLPVIAPEIMNRLKARVDKRRVCNSFHLSGSCDAGDRCGFDHEPLDEDCLPALEVLALSQPCTRRGGCRLDGCTHGHICQNPECKHRGGKAYCRIPVLSHLESLADTRYVPAVPKGGKPAVTGSSGRSSASG